MKVYPGYGATFTHHIAALERATTQDEWDHLATGAGAAARRFADRLDLLLDLAPTRWGHGGCWGTGWAPV